MGKAAMCIQMLQILNSGRVYKVSELADLLETNPRNIIEYKKELEEVGYYIISVPGKFGGYKLDKTSVIPSLKLTDEEKKALTDGAGYLEARNDFLLKKDFQSAMAKVYSSLKHNEPQEEPLVINRFPLAMTEDDLEARYVFIKNAIKENQTIEIDYSSLDNVKAKRIVEPYKVFMYNNAWYVIAFDENDNDYRYFKLNRIEKYNNTNKKFRRRLYYNESALIDEFGMKQNGEWIPIKLKITDSYAVMAQERLYGKNQKIEKLNDSTIVLSCEMQNKERIVSLVLSMGSNCEIMEPLFIKEEVEAKFKQMLLKYYGDI